MNQDSGVDLESLKVDGGMVQNDLLMQFQADLLGVPVIRPVVAETTALGAAYAAGLATGFWAEVEDLRENWQEDKRWEPKMDAVRARRVLQVLEEGRHPDVRLVRRRSPKVALRRTGQDDRHDHLADRGAGRRWRCHRRRHRVGRRAARLRRHPRRPRRPRRGDERALPRSAALGRPLRGQGPRGGPRVHRGERDPRTVASATIEDTGGLFVSTPDDDPAYGDEFLAGAPSPACPRRRSTSRRRCAPSRG